MDLAQELLRHSDNIDMGALASRFGVSEAQASGAVSALLPAILGGVQKQGAEQVGALGGAIGTPTEDIAGGNAVLGQIFGSKDVSRQVAAHAAAKTGLSDTVLKAMLPVIAGLVAKQFAGGGAGGGMLGGLLGEVIGGMGGQGAPAQGGAPGGLGGLGGLAGMLDRDGDGNPLDDIMDMFARK